MSINKAAVDFYRRASYWMVPPGFNAGFQNLYRKIRSANNSSAYREIFARNEKFHNIHKGERCFILATGPSINKQDLRPLKNEICIAVSEFYLHKDIKEIAPLYHVDAPNHPPFKMELPKMCFEGYRKYYPEKTTIFLGHTHYEYSYLKFLQQNPEFMSDNIYFLNYIESPTLNEQNYKNPDLWDITKPLFGVRTVVYCAIQLAVYMGFQEIYLLGCDHDYLANALIKRNSTDIEKNDTERMHFYKNQPGIYDREEILSTEELFIRYYWRWKQYRLIKQYIIDHRFTIFNATEGGILDVFPKVHLEKIIFTTKK